MTEEREKTMVAVDLVRDLDDASSFFESNPKSILTVSIVLTDRMIKTYSPMTLANTLTNEIGQQIAARLSEYSTKKDAATEADWEAFKKYRNQITVNHAVDKVNEEP